MVNNENENGNGSESKNGSGNGSGSKNGSGNGSESKNGNGNESKNGSGSGSGSGREVALHRIEQARECLRIAEIMIEISAQNSANRSYYCIFHAMRAVLALERLDSKNHLGVISAFRQRYIKTGIFAASFSRIIGSAFEIRNESDYEDFIEISNAQALQQIENAKLFLEAVDEYIAQRSMEEKY